MAMMSREAAWELLNRYNSEEHRIKHALTVEGVMRHFAPLFGGDPDDWGVLGLLHDLDYERWPEEHCIKEQELMREAGVDPVLIRAAASHGFGLVCDVEPQSDMEKTLYTIDELTGLIAAACLMRPSRSVLDIELKSVKKKFKTKGFAAGVDRAVIEDGANRMGMSLDEVIEHTILGMREVADAIGLRGNL